MPPVPSTHNPFFPLVMLFGMLFIVTIFAFIAALLGDPSAPLAKLLERNGTMLIIAEVAGIVVSGLCAMALDRYQTARKSENDRPTPPITTDKRTTPPQDAEISQ